MHWLEKDEMHFGKDSEGLIKPVNTSSGKNDSCGLLQGKPQIKPVVEAKAQDESEMPVFISFHICQDMIYRQMCGKSQSWRPSKAGPTSNSLPPCSLGL